MDNEIKSRLGKKDILTIPNMLSFFRILLIPVMAVLYCSYEAHKAAVVVIAISGITDILDGKIARKYNLVTDFGKFMDPIADKLLVCSALICFIELGKISSIIVLVIIAREFIIGGFRNVAAD